MAANTSPIFVNAVRCQTASLTTGSATLQTLFDPGAEGSRVDSVKLVADATTTAARFQILVNDGTNDRIIHDGLVAPLTASSTVAAWSTSVSLGILLEADDTLKVRLVSGAFTSGADLDVVAYGGDY